MFNKLVKGYGMDWGNATATIRWNHILNDKTNVNTSAVFSNYYYKYKSLSDGLRYVWKIEHAVVSVEVGLGEVSEQSADLEGRGEPALFHYDAR